MIGIIKASYKDCEAAPNETKNEPNRTGSP